MSNPNDRDGSLRGFTPAILLALLVGYAVLLHHGLGPRPEVPDSALRWWSPRGFLTDALVGSSWEWLLERPKGMAAFAAPAILLLAAVWSSTRGALARALAAAAMFACLLFLFYGLGSGVAQVAWTFFHWRASATMAAVAAVAGSACTAPWLAGSWLRLGWPARLAWAAPLFGIVLLVERNVTGTNPLLPFAISPWPAVQVFGFETLGTTLAAQFAGVALALWGMARLRSRRRLAGALAALAGFAIAPAAWWGLGRLELLPFRIAPGRLVGAAGMCALLITIAAFGVRFERARLRRRALHCATAALLLGVPLTIGMAWARIDYSRTRDVRARQIIEALARYYERDSVYPDSLDDLVRAGLLAGVPRPRIGFPLPDGAGEQEFLYQAFGTSYLLEFSAPRWVQCAYNPPYLDEEGEPLEADEAGAVEGAGAADAQDESGGAWSCPSKPPELW